MTDPLIIDVGKLGDRFFSQLAGRQDGCVPFDITGVAVQNGENLQVVGEKIRRELFRNKEIEKAITEIVKLENPDTRPIYINPTTNRADAIWWETLYVEPPGFLTLNRRWPIARITGVDTARPPTRFAPPLRILAVISAENRPGAAEWGALHSAADTARCNGFPVELCVLTGEQELYEQIKASPLPWVRLLPVSNKIEELDTQMGWFKPHILHFFCHGLLDAGSAWLSILTGLGEGKLPIDDVVAMPALENVWLVVLNSCLGGAPVGDSPSMALRLVSKGKVPFAIGATDPVDARDASTFSRAFFNRILYLLADDLKHAGEQDVVTLQTSGALLAAREAIANDYDDEKAASRQWVLPILYEHRTRLQIQKLPPRGVATPGQDPAAIAVQVEMATAMLARLPPGTPKNIKEALVASILNQIAGS